MDPSGVCSVHPGQPAVGPCEGCGAYGCATCLPQSPPRWCDACRRRGGLDRFPLNRDDWSVRRALRLAWGVWRREWLALSVGALLVTGATTLVHALTNAVLRVTTDPDGPLAAVGSPLVALFVEGALGVGFYAVCVDAAAGRTPQLGDLLRRLDRSGHVLIQILVVGAGAGAAAAAYALLSDTVWDLAGGFRGGWLASGLLSVVLVFGGLVALYPSLGLVFMQVELAYDRKVGPLQALARSWRLARGARRGILAVVVLEALVRILGLVLLCLGAVVAASFAELLFVVLFLALRNGSGLPAVSRLGETPALR